MEDIKRSAGTAESPSKLGICFCEPTWHGAETTITTCREMKQKGKNGQTVQSITCEVIRQSEQNNNWFLALILH